MTLAYHCCTSSQWSERNRFYFWCFPEEYQAAVYKENTPGHFDVIDDKEIGKVYFDFLKFYSQTLRALKVNLNLTNMLAFNNAVNPKE